MAVNVVCMCVVIYINFLMFTNTAQPEPLGCSLDLVFVLDSSGSIRDANPADGAFDNYALMLEFVIDIVNALNVGPGGTHVGLVFFSNDAINEFFLNSFSTRSDIVNAIRNLTYLGGDTHTAAGLFEMRQTQFTVMNGDRPDSDNVAIVITDGASTINTSLTVPNAVAARADGIRIVAIGITNEVNETEISLISSEPQVNGSNYFLTTNFQVLQPVLDTLVLSTECDPVVGKNQDPCGHSPTNIQSYLL